jgi:CheY-like chemotaxis protein
VKIVLLRKNPLTRNSVPDNRIGECLGRALKFGMPARASTWRRDLTMKRPRNSPTVKNSSKPTNPGARARRPVTVLHIDDDRNDAELFQAAARKANVQFSIHTVTDGEQAMAYLNGRGVYADRTTYPLPVLILLDLKMPRATGFEVLSWIRNHPEAGNLPVIIFSGSELQDDIQQAYAEGADSYMVKPLGFNELVTLVKSINTDWVAGRARQAAPLADAGSYRAWQSGPAWLTEPGSQARP